MNRNHELLSVYSDEDIEGYVARLRLENSPCQQTEDEYRERAFLELALMEEMRRWRANGGPQRLAERGSDGDFDSIPF